MNKNLNLVEILKNCPKGTKLYSTVLGDVYFYGVSKDARYPIGVTVAGNSDYRTFTSDGKLWIDYDGECALYPSKDQRDWGKFTIKRTKFDPETLQPFDQVLVWIDAESCWMPAIFTFLDCTLDYLRMVLYNGLAVKVIPYNDKTMNLIGQTKEAPEYYRYWED